MWGGGGYNQFMCAGCLGCTHHLGLSELNHWHLAKGCHSRAFPCAWPQGGRRDGEGKSIDQARNRRLRGMLWDEMMGRFRCTTTMTARNDSHFWVEEHSHLHSYKVQPIVDWWLAKWVSPRILCQTHDGCLQPGGSRHLEVGGPPSLGGINKITSEKYQGNHWDGLTCVFDMI